MEIVHDMTFDAVFKFVMRDTSIVKDVIECVLGKKIKSDVHVILEKETNPGPGNRAIRCDVHVKDDGEIIYDIEMQRKNDSPLITRMRGYQATLDVDAAQEGSKFDDLKDVYIVFICNFDFLHQGKARYWIEPRDIDDPETPVDARMHWVVLNASAAEYAHSAELASLLNYIRCGEVGESDLVKRIHNRVLAAQDNSEVKEMIEMQEKYELNTRNTATRVARLSAMLAEAGRVDDIGRIAEDETYRDQLYAEFGV